MQQFLDTYLIPKKEQLVVIAQITVFEIVCMALFDFELKIWNDKQGNVQSAYSKYDSFGSGTALQLVQAIFFFIGVLVLIPLLYLSFGHKKLALLANICFIGLGLFLGLIGMGICASSISDRQLLTNTKTFNYPVAFWFIQLMIFIVIFQYEYNLYKDINQPVKVENIQSVNSAPQQPIQYYAQPNAPYQPPNQQVIYQPIPPGQQQNSYPQ